MPNPSMLRDSTQIILPEEALGELETPLDDEFTVTIVAEGESHCRIVGSPVEIKEASQYLAKRGVAVR